MNTELFKPTVQKAAIVWVMLPALKFSINVGSWSETSLKKALLKQNAFSYNQI